MITAQTILTSKTKTLLPIFFVLLLLISFHFSAKAVFGAGSFYLSPDSDSAGVGENFNVDIIINTGGANTDGADALLNYDGTKLQVVSINSGTTYPTYPTKVSTGSTITIGGVSNTSGPYFSGIGVFATITFKGVAAGTAAITFKFTSGSTTDSNITENGTNSDILTSALGGTYSVSTSGGGGGGGGNGGGGTSSLPVSGPNPLYIIIFATSVFGLAFALREIALSLKRRAFVPLGVAALATNYSKIAKDYFQKFEEPKLEVYQFPTRNEKTYETIRLLRSALGWLLEAFDSKLKASLIYQNIQDHYYQILILEKEFLNSNQEFIKSYSKTLIGVSDMLFRISDQIIQSKATSEVEKVQMIGGLAKELEKEILKLETESKLNKEGKILEHLTHSLTKLLEVKKAS